MKKLITLSLIATVVTGLISSVPSNNLDAKKSQNMEIGGRGDQQNTGDRTL